MTIKTISATDDTIEGAAAAFDTAVNAETTFDASVGNPSLAVSAPESGGVSYTFFLALKDD